jgi:hypothetical protein
VLISSSLNIYVIGNVPDHVKMPVLGKIPIAAPSDTVPEMPRMISGVPPGVCVLLIVTAAHASQTPYLTVTSEKYEVQSPTHKLAPGINLVGSTSADSLKDLLLQGKVRRLPFLFYLCSHGQSIKPKHCAFVVDDSVTLIAFPDCLVLLNGDKMSKVCVYYLKASIAEPMCSHVRWLMGHQFQSASTR